MPDAISALQGPAASHSSILTELQHCLLNHGAPLVPAAEA